jgi:hypothetical protein
MFRSADSIAFYVSFLLLSRKPDLQIRFVTHLQTQQPLSQDSLCGLGDFVNVINLALYGRLVERQAEVPVHANDGGDVGHGVKEVVRVVDRRCRCLPTLFKYMAISTSVTSSTPVEMMLCRSPRLTTAAPSSLIFSIIDPSSVPCVYNVDDSCVFPPILTKAPCPARFRMLAI